jgi:hypothetical protein
MFNFRKPESACGVEQTIDVSVNNAQKKSTPVFNDSLWDFIGKITQLEKQQEAERERKEEEGE